MRRWRAEPALAWVGNSCWHDATHMRAPRFSPSFFPSGHNHERGGKRAHPRTTAKYRRPGGWAAHAPPTTYITKTKRNGARAHTCHTLQTHKREHKAPNPSGPPHTQRQDPTNKHKELAQVRHNDLQTQCRPSTRPIPTSTLPKAGHPCATPAPSGQSLPHSNASTCRTPMLSTQAPPHACAKKAGRAPKTLAKPTNERCRTARLLTKGLRPTRRQHPKAAMVGKMRSAADTRQRAYNLNNPQQGNDEATHAW